MREIGTLVCWATIRAVQGEINKRKNLCTTLYTDLKDGLLTQEEYVYAKQHYQEELAVLEQELSELQRIRTKTLESSMGEKRWNRLIAQYGKAETLTQEMLHAMVEEITLDSDSSISVRFRYKDEFEELLAECDRLKSLAG